MGNSSYLNKPFDKVCEFHNNHTKVTRYGRWLRKV